MKQLYKPDSNSLIIFPCCSEKNIGGKKWKEERNGLKRSISAELYLKTLKLREKVFALLSNDKKYISEKYQKNKKIVLGPDFGNNNFSGNYLSAVERYKGSLYSAIPSFHQMINKCLEDKKAPMILILSALYGPLHPGDMIQDYNLQMSDRPSYRIWKSAFPDILKGYVQENSVNSIFLYLGNSTAYMKVAKKAVRPLIEERLIKEAFQCEVIKGNSYHTPYNHGLLLGLHLAQIQSSKFTRKITIRKL
jgi:hypothetical protein